MIFELSKKLQYCPLNIKGSTDRVSGRGWRAGMQKARNVVSFAQVKPLIKEK